MLLGATADTLSLRVGAGRDARGSAAVRTADIRKRAFAAIPATERPHQLAGPVATLNREIGVARLAYCIFAPAGVMSLTIARWLWTTGTMLPAAIFRFGLSPDIAYSFWNMSVS